MTVLIAPGIALRYPIIVMKRLPWLILIAVSLLGMFLAPRAAYSAQFQTIELVRPVMPTLPVTLPGRPLPMPNAIPGPAIQLPSPVIPLVAVPERIQAVAFVAPHQESKGLFTAARKMFADAPGGKGPSEGQLRAGFDEGAKASAPAVSAGGVETKDAVKPQPKKRVERSRVIQVPTWELENEIGI